MIIVKISLLRNVTSKSAILANMSSTIDASSSLDALWTQLSCETHTAVQSICARDRNREAKRATTRKLLLASLTVIGISSHWHVAPLTIYPRCATIVAMAFRIQCVGPAHNGSVLGGCMHSHNLSNLLTHTLGSQTLHHSLFFAFFLFIQFSSPSVWASRCYAQVDWMRANYPSAGSCSVLFDAFLFFELATR